MPWTDRIVTRSALPTDLAAREDAGFPVRVTRSVAALIAQEPANGPLRRQFAADERETLPAADFVPDPVGDMDSLAGRGILHKYHGRVLLVATGACAVHCRYCFRRHFPYGKELAARNGWREAVDYIEGDTSIREVILSGGDPLMLGTPRLVQLTDRLRSVDHIERLRIHSRVPVVLGARIDHELCDWLADLPWATTLVVHVNHPDELRADGATVALQRLRDAGAQLLNQSVLLRDVNDKAPLLADLSERLFERGVLPYYLHQLDQVQGAAHFAVPDQRARAIIEALRQRLPGYLVPRLVREESGQPAKTPL